MDWAVPSRYALSKGQRIQKAKARDEAHTTESGRSIWYQRTGVEVPRTHETDVPRGGDTRSIRRKRYESQRFLQIVERLRIVG